MGMHISLMIGLLRDHALHNSVEVTRPIAGSLVYVHTNLCTGLYPTWGPIAGSLAVAWSDSPQSR